MTQEETGAAPCLIQEVQWSTQKPILLGQTTTQVEASWLVYMQYNCEIKVSQKVNLCVSHHHPEEGKASNQNISNSFVVVVVEWESQLHTPQAMQ